MSLQSPFGPDVQAQLMGLAGYGGQQMPSRDPGDMGTREQFMRMMAENRFQGDQQFQRQMQLMLVRVCWQLDPSLQQLA